MTLYFTADLHLGHANVITYSKRPFKDVEEMNEAIVSNWNRVVAHEDTVYILGDVALCHPKRAVGFLHRMKGRKTLIAGNHDKACLKKKDFRDQFVEVIDFGLEIKVQDPDCVDGHQRIVMCHYALRTWAKSGYGSWNLHGHSHNSLAPIGRQLDVGVDGHNFTPVSYNQVKAIMKTRGFVKVDHHGEDTPEGT